jgi:orotate phosphoribosyltransferase
VLLVYDVYTTGTTASECARVLRRAGAAKVWVATVARTLKLASKGEGFKVSVVQGLGAGAGFAETLEPEILQH